MVLKIIWSPESLNTFLDTLEYVKTTWSDREAQDFSVLVNKKLELLLKFPRLGRRTRSVRNSYRTVIHKRITLVYHYKPRKKEIELVTFWNNWQNPNRLRH